MIPIYDMILVESKKILDVFDYQFANLYLGKNMKLSQEKLIQTLGRGKQVPYARQLICQDIIYATRLACSLKVTV